MAQRNVGDICYDKRKREDGVQGGRFYNHGSERDIFLCVVFRKYGEDGPAIHEKPNENKDGQDNVDAKGNYIVGNPIYPRKLAVE